MRTLYEKYIEVCVLWSPYRSLHSNAFAQFDPTNSAAWIKYAELETQLADFARVRAIFELGVSQTALSMPELLWKAYIDFETEEGEREKARDLYERLVQLSGHVKVWISYATFEAEPIPIARALREEAEDEEEEEVPMVEGDPVRARQVFDRAYKDLKGKGLKHEVRTLLIHWPMRVAHICGIKAGRATRNLEDIRGEIRFGRGCREGSRYDAHYEQAQDRRQRDGSNGRRYVLTCFLMLVLPLMLVSVSLDWDIVFADDERESNPTSFKFLQMAHAWKALQGKAGTGSSAAPLSGFIAAAASTASSSGSKGDTAKAVKDHARDHDDGSSDVASSNGDGDER